MRWVRWNLSFFLLSEPSASNPPGRHKHNPSKMSAMDLGPANPRISPLIKLSRWTLLGAGILWGAHRYRVNKNKEDELRAYNARMKPVWDAEKAMKAAKENREQMIYLAKETGVEVPPNF